MCRIPGVSEGAAEAAGAAAAADEGAEEGEAEAEAVGVAEEGAMVSTRRAAAKRPADEASPPPSAGESVSKRQKVQAYV